MAVHEVGPNDRLVVAAQFEPVAVSMLEHTGSIWIIDSAGTEFFIVRNGRANHQEDGRNG